jgi:hypothetical protein
VIAGVPAACGQRSHGPGDPGSGLRSPQGSLGSSLGVADARSALGLEARGAAAVACAAGSPACRPTRTRLTGLCAWSGLSFRASTHVRSQALQRAGHRAGVTAGLSPGGDSGQGRSYQRPRAANQAERDSRCRLPESRFPVRQQANSFLTRRCACVPACPRKANVAGRKVEAPAYVTGAPATSASFHTLDVTTDGHGIHASAG